MRLLTKYGWHAAVMIWVTACFAFFQLCYPYHFYYQEQNQLFLWSADYLSTYFQKPAWMACMTGDFLTQFYYYRYVGPLILSLAIGLLGFVVAAAIKRMGVKCWVAFVLAFMAMAVEMVFSLHYAFRLCSVLSLVGGGLLFLLTPFMRSRENIISACFPFVGVLLCHWLFGYGVFLYVVLTIADSIICRRQLLARISLVLLPLAGLGVTKRWYLLDVRPLYAYPGTGQFVMPALSLEKTFGVATEYHFGNYNRVIRMVEEERQPNDIQLYYYNLVMAQRGLLPEVLLRYPNNVLGTFYKIGPDSPSLVIQNMDELYWTLGDMTFCERAAIMANVFSPSNRNIAKVKRLAEVNVVTGDTLAAHKYLRVLCETYVYKDWASRLLADDRKTRRPYLDKRKFVNQKDTLRKTDHARVILLELMESNPKNTIALDYLLCSDLLAKDITSFRQDYDRFYFLFHGSRSAPKLYQQALCVSLAAQEAPANEWQRYITSREVYRQFVAYNEERGAPKYKSTYWYYFDKGEIKQ